MAICCRMTVKRWAMFTMSVREIKTPTMKINTLKMVKVERVTDW
jgi:hypothetical protein